MNTNPDSVSHHKGSRFKYIPNALLHRYNRIAEKNKKRSLTEDCPILKDGHNAPIFLALPGIDATGWVRCQIPAVPECSSQVFLDIRQQDFDDLPTIGGEAIESRGDLSEF